MSKKVKWQEGDNGKLHEVPQELIEQITIMGARLGAWVYYQVTRHESGDWKMEENIKHKISELADGLEMSDLGEMEDGEIPDSVKEMVSHEGKEELKAWMLAKITRKTLAVLRKLEDEEEIFPRCIAFNDGCGELVEEMKESGEIDSEPDEIDDPMDLEPESQLLN